MTRTILRLTLAEQVFACKKCKKCFRKDAAEFEERYALPTSDREKVYTRLTLCTIYVATSTVHTATTTSFWKPSHRSRLYK